MAGSEDITKGLREWARGMAGGTPSLCERVLAIADRIDAAHDEAVDEAHDAGYRDGVAWCRECGSVAPAKAYADVAFDPDSPDPEGIAQLEGWAVNVGKVGDEASDRILGMCRSIRTEWRAKLRRQCDKAVAQATAELTKGLPTFDEEVAELSDGYLERHGLARLPRDADGKPWHVGDVAESSGETFTVAEIAINDGKVWLREKCRAFGYDASTARHHKPMPAERIRAIADNIYGHGYVGEDHRDEYRDALYAIADEMEGEGR